MEQRDYLKEAFEFLRPLREAEEFDLSNKLYTGEIEDFVKADDVDPDEFDDSDNVLDLGAYQDDQLAQDYTGQYIIECKCCHLRMFKPTEDLEPNEDQSAVNEGEECPQCGNLEGYFVIGKVAEADFSELGDEEEFEEEPVDIDDVDDADDDASMAKLDGEFEEEPEEEVEESCKVNEAKGGKGGIMAKINAFLGESKEECKDGECKDGKCKNGKCKKEMNEAINNIQIDGDDESFTLDKGEDGSVSININPTDSFAGGEGELEVQPLDDEDMADIEAIEPEDEEAAAAEFEEEPMEGEEEPMEGEEEMPAEEEAPVEGEEEMPEEEGEEEEFDGFAHESFQVMAGKFMTENYNNIKNFKVTDVAENKNQIVVEGKITYKSGKSGKTSFVFTEARETSKGKLVLEGYNKTFTEAKAFKVLGEMKNRNYTPEMFKFNYKVTKNLNESLAKPVLVEGIYVSKKKIA